MLFIDVYKSDNKIATSGATLLSGLDLHRTYRAIDSVATGRINIFFILCLEGTLPKIMEAADVMIYTGGSTPTVLRVMIASLLA